MIASMQSNQARTGWRAMLDQIMMHASTFVIKRFEQPIAVVLSYAEWKELVQLREIQEACRRRAEMVNDPSSVVTLEEIEKGLGSAQPL